MPNENAIPTARPKLSASRHLRRPSVDLDRRKALSERFRNPFGYLDRRLVLALALAILVAVATGSIVNNARRHAADWGAAAPVWVATEPIPLGIPVSSLNAQMRSLPMALLPQQPITTLAEEPMFAVAPIAAGQVLSAVHFLPDRSGLTPEERAVTLPLPLAAPTVDAGEVVEIYAVAVGSTGAQARLLTPRARIAGRDENGITVVVDRTVVPKLLASLANGSVEFARRPSQR